MLLVMMTSAGVRLVEGGREGGLLVVDVGRGAVGALPVVVAETGLSGRTCNNDRHGVITAG